MQGLLATILGHLDLPEGQDQDHVQEPSPLSGHLSGRNLPCLTGISLTSKELVPSVARQDIQLHRADMPVRQIRRSSSKR